MEKALIVTYDLATAYKEKNRPAEEARALAELTASLADGWSVKATSAFSGTDRFHTAALVILEKK
jgi:hypothetical protein